MQFSRRKSIVRSLLVASPFFVATMVFFSPAYAKLPTKLTRYKLAISDEKASEQIGKAVDSATEEMNFFTRPIARMALKKYALPIIHEMAFGSDAETVTVKLGPNRGALTLKNGGRATVIIENGEKVKARITFDKNMITQENVTNRGTKKFDCVFSKDGTRVNITFWVINKDKLPQPIRVTLPYVMI